MRGVLIILVLLLSFFFLRYTKIGSFIVIKFIQFLHLLLCLFIILGPFFIKDKEILIFYILVVSFIIFHWVLSSDVCALTLLEQWITGNSSESTFIGRIVKPVYNVTNKHITCITVFLLLIAITRLIRMYKRLS